MKKNLVAQKNNTSDCDIILDDIENSMNKLGYCFESAFDSRKSKMHVVGSIFGFGYSLTKLAFDTTSCAVKNAPKAVVAVAAIKRDIVNAIDEEIAQNEKQKKQDALEQKIKQLQLKR